MVAINPMKIPDRWRDGYTLDYHTIKSDFVGYDEYGNARFATTRSAIGELLYRLKYQSDQSVIAEIADAAAAFVRGWVPVIEMIVPVTPSRARPVQPVWLLGEAVASRLGVRFDRDCIRRVRDTPELKNVHEYGERIRLLQGTHEVSRDRTEGHKILLFDDLYRSGATMNEVTANLYDQGGASDVFALTITRTRGG